jgi:hypothetical protein
MYPRLWRELVLPILRTPGSSRNRFRIVSTERFHASASSVGVKCLSVVDLCGLCPKLLAGNLWGTLTETLTEGFKNSLVLPNAT